MHTGGRRGGVQFDLDSMSIPSNNADEFKKGAQNFMHLDLYLYVMCMNFIGLNYLFSAYLQC